MWSPTPISSPRPRRSRPTAQQVRRGAPRRRPAACRPSVDALEARRLLASLTVTDVALVGGHAGTRNAAVVVGLDAPVSRAVTVHYTTADGTARAGGDYQALSGRLTFAPGQTRKAIPVPVSGDRPGGADANFFVKIGGARHAKIADGRGAVTILAEEPRLRVGDLSAAEEAPGAAPVRRPSATATVLAGGLLKPSKIIQTPLHNLLVAEVGPAQVNASRVSIVDADGHRRTLVDGLPSAVNAVNSSTGASGLYLQGRTLFVAIGEGDVTLPGPIPRTEIANPTPASPIFSSVLAVHFSAGVEKDTTGISLTLADHHALKAGERLVRFDAAGRKITVELVVDFPDYVPEPLPTLATNVRHSHPYGVVADDDHLYVVDGGYNLVYKVDIASGLFETLVSFPRTPNPTTLGPPQIENVPTSIRWDGDQLLVTLLSGFPFIAGLSEVRRVDPDTGANVALIRGLGSAIDVIPLARDGQTLGYLTLEYSLAHRSLGPGRLQLFDASANPVAVLSNALMTPTSMVYDRRRDSVIVTEINSGKLLNFPLPSGFMASE